jgi:hypothetical protein
MLKAIYAKSRARHLYVTAFLIVGVLVFIALLFFVPPHVAIVKSDKLPVTTKRDHSLFVPAPPIGDEVHQKTE